jgi:hypothetical protein
MRWLPDLVSPLVLSLGTSGQTSWPGARRSCLLCIGAAQGLNEAARLLLRAMANVNEPDNVLYTPLHHAAGKGHLELVKVSPS